MKAVFEGDHIVFNQFKLRHIRVRVGPIVLALGTGHHLALKSVFHSHHLAFTHRAAARGASTIFAAVLLLVPVLYDNTVTCIEPCSAVTSSVFARAIELISVANLLVHVFPVSVFASVCVDQVSKESLPLTVGVIQEVLSDLVVREPLKLFGFEVHIFALHAAVAKRR
jgi:hypothetical protein